jgi:hypothetical protein
MDFKGPLSVGDMLKTYTRPVTKITNQRQLVIKDFLDEINAERVGTKFPQIVGDRIPIFCMKVSHLSQFDLVAFLSICRDSKRRTGSFSKCFFGSLKVVNSLQKQEGVIK